MDKLVKMLLRRKHLVASNPLQVFCEGLPDCTGVNISLSQVPLALQQPPRSCSLLCLGQLSSFVPIWHPAILCRVQLVRTAAKELVNELLLSDGCSSNEAAILYTKEELLSVEAEVRHASSCSTSW